MILSFTVALQMLLEVLTADFSLNAITDRASATAELSLRFGI
jgi:hypothetical protein